MSNNNESALALKQMNFGTVETQASIKSGADAKVMLESITQATVAINEQVNQRVKFAKDNIEEQNKLRLKLLERETVEKVTKDLEKQYKDKIQNLEDAAKSDDETIEDLHSDWEKLEKKHKDEVEKLQKKLRTNEFNHSLDDLTFLLAHLQGDSFFKGWRKSGDRVILEEARELVRKYQFHVDGE